MSLVAYDKSMMLFNKNNGPNVLGHEMVDDHKSRTCLGIIIINNNNNDNNNNFIYISSVFSRAQGLY